MSKNKFDICLMNPPYQSNLHLMFLDKVINIADTIINISPSDCFTNINVQNKLSKKLAKYINSLEIITADNANKEFNILLSSNLGIGVFNKNAKGFIPQFAEVQHIIEHIRKHKSIRSAINLTKGESTNKYYTGIQGDYGYAKIWHYSLSEIFIGNPNARIGFDTSIELNNFINSVKNCWPYKLMYIIDDNAAVITHLPFMGDYTKAWTDDDFYKFFDINEHDKILINNILDQYYNA